MTDYNVFAKDWDKTRQKLWPEFEVLYPLIQKGDRFLDSGCGNGRLRNYVSRETVKDGAFFGVDKSSVLIEIARAKNPKDNWFVGDFEKSLPFGADQFHVVASVASFHHLLSYKDQLFHLTELARVTRPGGVIFMTNWILPSKYFWLNFWQGRVFTKNWLIPFGKEKHPRYYRQVTFKDLRKLSRKVGLEIVGERTFEGRNRVVVFKKN